MTRPRRLLCPHRQPPSEAAFLTEARREMAMEQNDISGRCLCGTVRFKSSGQVLARRSCWCRDCQYLACGNASVNIIVEAVGIAVEGDLATYESRSDSGNLIRRSFCPNCGTPMFCEAVGEPDYRVIRVGALDDRDNLGSNIVIWTASAPSWALFGHDAEIFVGQP